MLVSTSGGHFGILLLMLDILQLAESTGEIQDMHSTN